MSPTQTGKSNHLKSARLTRITSEEVAQVESSHQVNIHTINESLSTHQRLRILLREHVQINISSQTEYSCQVLTNANAQLRSEALEETIVTKLLLRSSNTSVDTHVPVVTSLVSCDSCVLCIYRSCHKAGSEH